MKTEDCTVDACTTYSIYCVVKFKIDGFTFYFHIDVKYTLQTADVISFAGCTVDL